MEDRKNFKIKTKGSQEVQEGTWIKQKFLALNRRLKNSFGHIMGKGGSMTVVYRSIEPQCFLTVPGVPREFNLVLYY